MSIRVAYCIPSLYYPSGMERVLTLKANYLAEFYGYKIFIILTDGKEKKPYYDLSPKVTLINLDIRYDDIFRMPLIRRAWHYLQKQRKFKKKLKEILFDLRPDITVSLLRRDINLINHISDGSLKVGEIHFSRANYRDLQREKLFYFVKKVIAGFWMKQLISELKRLNRFVVLSQEDKEKWPELTNVTVIHNPLSFFPEKVSDCKARQVIAVGRYVYQKAFDLLIQAWSIVSAKHPDWVLKIYGDGMRDELTAQIRSLDLENSCFLEHTVPDITEKFVESSIFALSSRYEGFGMVITEAMACGVPPVSFACPCGPKDIIRDGEDGLLVENGDIEGLAKKIIYLIENEGIRIRMGYHARINVERFKIEKIMLQWKELFESLMAEKNKENKT